MESEYVKEYNLEDEIDISYYDSLVTEAVSTITAYVLDGGFEGFMFGPVKTEYREEVHHVIPFA